MRVALPILLTALLWSNLADAQGCVETAVPALERGDYSGARAALGACEGGAELDTAGLARFHEAWALIHAAEGETDDLDVDLRRLAAVAPGHRFSDLVPPRIRERFAELRPEVPRPSLQLSGERSGDGVLIGGQVLDDPQGVVRQIRLFGRIGEDGEWTSILGERLTLGGEGDVAYYGRAEGLGGALVASTGSPDDPFWLRRDAGNDDVLIWGIIGGAAAAVVVAIALGVGLGLGAQSSDRTQLTAPMLDGWMLGG